MVNFMEDPAVVIVNFFKALIVIGVIGVFLSVAAFFITYLFELKNIREEKSRLSTGVGNALLVLHSFLEPASKPRTEQIVWIRKRRTPLEKKVKGLAEFDYDKLFIKGYRILKNKRYRISKLKT